MPLLPPVSLPSQHALCLSFPLTARSYDNLKAEDLTNINITQEYPHPVNATQVPLFNIDFDEENNSQADYETIE